MKSKKVDKIINSLVEFAEELARTGVYDLEDLPSLRKDVSRIYQLANELEEIKIRRKGELK